jgi:hypothetical protein
MKQECRTCRWFDPRENYCIECEIYCHDGDGEKCDFYQGGWVKDDGKSEKQGV